MSPLRLALAVVLVAGCSAPIVQTPRAHEAPSHFYARDIDDVREAARAELTERYGGANIRAQGRFVVAWAQCRDADGDPCTRFMHAIPSRRGSSNTSTSSAYWDLDVMAIVDGDDGDVQVRVGARIAHRGRAPVYVNDPGAPAWLLHEADVVRSALDQRLR
jgi:hypothetical protein